MRQCIFPTDVTVGISYRNQWIKMIVRNKHLHCMSELSLVIDAVDSSRHSNATIQSGKQKRRQNCDDGDDNQKLNQGER